MSSNEDKIKQARRNLAKKATNFKTAFSAPAGAQVLKGLKEEFGRDMLCKTGATPRDDTVAAAQHDVIAYINLMINFEENENE